MLSLKTELVDLQHPIAGAIMADTIKELAWPNEVKKLSIRYGASPSVYTPKRARKLILAAAARPKVFNGNRSRKRGSRKDGGARGRSQKKGDSQQIMSNGTRKEDRCAERAKPVVNDLMYQAEDAEKHNECVSSASVQSTSE
ncbi:hypothetical protein PInf_001521 [Phytophthora infestans]|nr:hypothetical protein PInf_001488 [Phytophthora infestans]KAI9997593.1 hypothetical protein PInf_001521 [Phytophthora infestans]